MARAKQKALAPRQISVELAGPDVPLVIQHNGELLRALETLAAQMLRLDHHEHDMVSFDAGNFKALRAEELRLAAEAAAEKVRQTGSSLQLSAHEQPRAAHAASDLQVTAGCGDGQRGRGCKPLPRGLSRGQDQPARHAAVQAARVWTAVKAGTKR
jgi:spoIIIJ-associated protein